MAAKGGDSPEQQNGRDASVDLVIWQVFASCLSVGSRNQWHSMRHRSVPAKLCKTQGADPQRNQLPLPDTGGEPSPNTQEHRQTCPTNPKQESSRLDIIDICAVTHPAPSGCRTTSLETCVEEGNWRTDKAPLPPQHPVMEPTVSSRVASETLNSCPVKTP